MGSNLSLSSFSFLFLALSEDERERGRGKRNRLLCLLLAGGGENFVDAALHVEVTFGDVVELAGEDHLEAADDVLEGHVLAGRADEDFGELQRLREEALDLQGAIVGL